MKLRLTEECRKYIAEFDRCLIQVPGPVISYTPPPPDDPSNPIKCANCGESMGPSPFDPAKVFCTRCDREVVRPERIWDE